MEKNYEMTTYFEELFQATNQSSMLLLDANPDTFEERLFKAMGIVGKAVDVDRMYIWKNFLIDEKLHCSQIYEWSEEAEPQQDTDLTMNIAYDDVMVGLEELLSSGQSLNSIVAEMIPEHKEHLVAQGILSILIVPVFINSRFWGFVGFDDCHQERIFTDNEEKILRSSALLFGHAYHHNEANRLIRDQKEKIYEDSLTGIYNRRFFDEKSESYSLMKSPVHADVQLSLLLLDIDLFKEYNDGYGHQKGDECLKAVARILSVSLSQPGDFVARYGGEEFVIVLPFTDAEGARSVAERVIRNMRKANIPHEYSKVADHITFSIGVTSGTMRPSLTVDDFVKVADNMLYSAKEAGRNRYIFGEVEKSFRIRHGVYKN
jgi:diguanylate cyclase (GGDEF)-like protein